MAGNVTVDRAAMVTAAAQVDSALAEIKGYQNRMSGYQAELSGQWKEAFSSDFTIVITALNSIHEKLVGSHANYNAVEAANTSSMNKISAALKG